MSAERAASEVLAEAASAATAAPSIHNTQPWRWRVHPDRLELYAERDRQLLATDPDGRMLAVSCGAALHHARVALAAMGWQYTVSRRPEPADADLLARIGLGDRGEVSPDAMRLYQTVRVRHTDRRPVTRQNVPSEALAALVKAANDEGVQLQVLRPDQVDDLAVAIGHAATASMEDPAIQEELQRWTGGARAEGAGIPDTAIPEEAPHTNVAARTFAHPGSLPVGGDNDRTASYALLHGDTDELVDWLRAGEALSAIWLTAVELGVGVTPFSEAVEMPASRQTLRRTLAFLGWPYLALRLGIPDPDQPGPKATPRLPVEETVEVTDRS
jgi:nitroreductase